MRVACVGDAGPSGAFAFLWKYGVLAALQHYSASSSLDMSESKCIIIILPQCLSFKSERQSHSRPPFPIAPEV